MEKLSSILPKSPRTQNVDNSKAQPARPGAPLLGRPMGRVTQTKVFESQIQPELSIKETPDLSFADKFSVDPKEDRISISGDAGMEEKLASYNRKGEMHKVKIADDVSRKFAAINLAENADTNANSEAINVDGFGANAADSIQATQD